MSDDINRLQLNKDTDATVMLLAALVSLTKGGGSLNITNNFMNSLEGGTLCMRFWNEDSVEVWVERKK